MPVDDRSAETSRTRYVLGDLIGRGGMAEVFAGRAHGSHGFEKPIAIKRLLPELANDRSFVERLVREAKLLVGVQHGNIVSVLDLAREGDDVFLVMEFVDGPSLRQLMKRRGERGVSLGLGTYVVQAAAAGLAFAHSRPAGAIIHADVSPSNLLLTTSGEVRVADFGIARGEGGNGLVEGKWAYMAPEQVRGDLTVRCDVFALGVVLYQLITGQHPLGESVTLQERRQRPLAIVPPRIVNPQVPAGLDAVCMRALAARPGDRFARMQDLIDALVEERFTHGWREGANELELVIREITPWCDIELDNDARAAAPLVTLVTSSLLVEELGEDTVVTRVLALTECDNLSSVEAMPATRPATRNALDSHAATRPAAWSNRADVSDAVPTLPRLAPRRWALGTSDGSPTLPRRASALPVAPLPLPPPPQPGQSSSERVPTLPRISPRGAVSTSSAVVERVELDEVSGGVRANPPCNTMPEPSTQRRSFAGLRAIVYEPEKLAAAQFVRSQPKQQPDFSLLVANRPASEPVDLFSDPPRSPCVARPSRTVVFAGATAMVIVLIAAMTPGAAARDVSTTAELEAAHPSEAQGVAPVASRVGEVAATNDVVAPVPPAGEAPPLEAMPPMPPLVVETPPVVVETASPSAEQPAPSPVIAKRSATRPASRRIARKVRPVSVAGNASVVPVVSSPAPATPELGMVRVETSTGEVALAFLGTEHHEAPGARFRRAPGTYKITLKDPTRGITRTCAVTFERRTRTLTVSLDTGECEVR